MEGKVPEDKNKTRRIKYQANRYVIMNKKLYKWCYAMPYLRCLQPNKVEYIIREIHEGVMQQPFKEKKCGTERTQTRVLLADHAEGFDRNYLEV